MSRSKLKIHSCFYVDYYVGIVTFYRLLKLKNLDLKRMLRRKDATG